MPGSIANHASSGLSRRSFLKTTAAVAGGVWAGSALNITAQTAFADEASEASAANEEYFNVCCRPNCFNTCMMKATVRDGKLVRTEPADFPDTSWNRTCLRGLVSNENIYNPERVLYPMKQTGERGSDNWERITWEEAISEIAEKINDFRAEFGDSSIFKASGSSVYHATSNLTGKLFGEINASTMSGPLDAGNMYGFMRVLGYGGHPWPGNDPHDYVNAKNLFLWNNNLTDAQIHDWHFVADAIEAGTNVICIDPIFTQMAAKSHKWVPVRPGADLPLVMGMMNVMFEEDLIDWDFVRDHTSAPFLVKEDGMLARMSDLGVEPVEGDINPMTGQPTIIDPYVVWDQDTDAAAELSTVTNPALEGEFDLDGQKVKTVLSVLREEIDKYTPAEASKLCEVPEETIRELAELAADGPVTHRIGWGSQAYDNGIAPNTACAIMAALAGQYGKPGANCSSAQWYVLGGLLNGAAAAASAPVTSPSIAYWNMPTVFETGEYLGEPVTPKALYVYSGNPLCTWCDTNVLRDQIFGQFELIVTADYMMTDTARYSDYILPCAHWFEYEDVITSGNTFHIIHSEKAIEPLGKAKPDLEICYELGKALGLEDGVMPADGQTFLQNYFDSETAAAMGITYDAVCEQNAIHAGGGQPFMQWQDLNFATGSGRAEFYLENPTPYGVNGKEADLSREHIPTWFEPREAWTSEDDEFPYVLMSERPRYRVHGQWAYNRILRELDPEPTVKINPADAQKEGLEDGAIVECYNNHGHAVAKLVYNEAIRPGTMVYPKSWQAAQHIAGSWSEPVSCETDPVLCNQSFMDCAVAIRAWEGAEE